MDILLHVTVCGVYKKIVLRRSVVNNNKAFAAVSKDGRQVFVRHYDSLTAFVEFGTEVYSLHRLSKAGYKCVFYGSHTN